MPGNHKNVIEINGKLFDAKTGMLLSNMPVVNPVSKPTPSIDGIAAPKTVRQPRPHKERPQPTNRKHHGPQRSQTLMRHAVKKPVANNKPPEVHSFKKPVTDRDIRASQATKSPFINHYGTPHQTLTRRSAPLSVKPAPEAQTSVKPVAHHAPKTHSVPAQAAPTSKSEELFTKALDKQDAKPKVKTKKQRSKSAKVLRWGSGVAAVLLLAGFIAYMNVANINVKYASSRAGFAAAMPAYQPSGYSFQGPVSYKPGQVAINFKSNTDERSYKVTQEVSSWTSQSLQENYLTARNKTFQTLQEGGRTVFMYDNGNATWVNGGVWYQVESNSLSSDQLLKIASSL